VFIILTDLSLSMTACISALLQNVKRKALQLEKLVPSQFKAVFPTISSY